MTDMIRKSDALAACQGMDPEGDINNLPAVTVGVKPLTSETGHFAEATVRLVKTLQRHGLTVGAGQSDSDELDFCVTVYHGKELLGCASLHEDRTWSCYMTVGETVFKCESTPWHSLPEGMDAALAALTPTPVDVSQAPDPAVNAPDPAVVEIDLRAVMMEQLEEAAGQSPWVPPEYMMNEIISDCCAFLREPRAPDPAAIREALRIVQSHVDYVRDEGAFDAGWNAAVQSIETEILALIAKGSAE